MARETSLLTSRTPTSIAKTKVHIGHVQLRDLIICPQERGIVNYVQHQAIVEHNLQSPGESSSPRTLVELSFTPNTLTSLPIEGTNQTLLAAGGQDAEIHLSLHAPSSSRPGLSNLLWQWETRLKASINNSVLLTSLSLNRSYESSIEPRIAISNNDCTVKFFDIPMRTPNSKRILSEAGALKLEVPVNHSSISPDGRTLLSVGDCNKAWLHQLHGGSQLTFTPISTLHIPSPTMSPHFYPSPSLAASFSTAFNQDGSKFVVASQEGVVAIWDVRSTKPLKIFHTDKSRMPNPGVGGSSGGGIGSGSAPVGNGGAVGWLSDDPWEWTREQSKAPGWSVRNVKFGGGKLGKEIMVFTEHTALVHIVDARTFETEEIMRVPSAGSPSRRALSSSTSRRTPTNANLSPQHQAQAQASQRRLRYSAGPAPVMRPGLHHHHRHHSHPHLHPHGHSGHHHHPHIVQALGDTFRIPGSASPGPGSRTGGGGGGGGALADMTSEEAWRTFRWTVRRERREGDRSDSADADLDGDGDPEDILVIPSLGMGGVESDVQALLSGGSGRRGIWSPGMEEGDGGRAGRGDVMEDDDDDDMDEDDGDVYRDPNTGSTHGDYEYNLRRSPAARRNSGFVGGGGGGPRRDHDEDDMEVDELAESECGSSRTPSRSSSPSPPSPTARQRRVALSPPAAPIIPPAVLPQQVVPRLNHPWTMGSAIGGGSTFAAIQSPPRSSSATISTASPPRGSLSYNDPPSSSPRRGVNRHVSGGGESMKPTANYERDLDLAGICFDASGSYLYAATKESVVEWSVRGMDKKWWGEGRWA
ncbi:hypothetical protein AX16_005446 [Volvariella volvacea WC 439]|nr:hypothetical protein AX16_005446 [Volvariella volvacea WC 439]